MNRNIFKRPLWYFVVITLLVFMLSGTNAFADVIIDNDDSGTSYTGTWTPSSASGYYGSNSLFARPEATYTWQFDSQPSGEYEVLMWWTETATRGSAISVDTNHTGGTETVIIDQTANDGNWNSLGTYYFDSSGSVIITASGDLLPDGRTVSTCADAVWFRYISSNEIVIDNGDPGTSYTGTWSPSSGSGFYDSNSLYARPDATYTWQFDSQPAGTYEVYMWWTTTSTRGDAVPVNINGLETVTINQLTGGGQWNYLGTYSFDGSGYVTVMAVGSTSTCADAVRFVSVNTNSSPTANIVSITPNPAPNGEEISFVGEGADDDGSIAAYEWNSSLDGLLSSDASFISSILTEGVHEISFRVQDDEGSWSATVINSLVVGNPDPVAVIDSISPNPAGPDVSVVFVGHGDAFGGAAITAYSWESDIDGLLSSEASFTADHLSLGTHAISFTVTDSNGEVSAAVQQELVIEYPEIIIDNGDVGISYTGEWLVSSRPNHYGDFSLYSRDGATYTWSFTPLISANYIVKMWWTDYFNRSDNVPVEISYEGNSQTVYINQQVNGGQWNSLGQYYFEADNTYTVMITAQPGPSSTCADAVQFVQVSDEVAPLANFSADNTGGVMPVFVQFSDLSTGDIDAWLWDFGDGTTSTEQNPSHEYLNAGDYTVSLTVTNAFGADTESKNAFIRVANSNVENIYIALGWGSQSTNWTYTEYDISDIGGVEIEPDVWEYTNTDKGVTYYIRPINTVEAFEAALREEGAHLIYIGHSNYGLGLAFLSYSQQTAVRFFDDPLISNVSTDWTAPSISGLMFGQAYPNWEPIYQNGESAIMPYDFGDPRGLPPYNYLASYKLPGDPTYYRVEAADGSYIERFPSSGFPAWFSDDGSSPDPDLNPEYYITNPAVDYPHVEYVGEWPWASPGDWHIELYNGQTYQYHSQGYGANRATYYSIVNTPGVYNVYATWYPEPANATNTPYTIQHTSPTAGEYTTVLANQETGESLNFLGTFDYTEAGAYTIEVSDDADGTVIADSVTLFYADDPGSITKAEFSSDLREGAGSLTVQFIDRSCIYIQDIRRPSVTYHWDFGDGNTSEVDDPLHTYTSSGVYTVSLTVRDENENSDTETKTNYIYVDNAVPTAPQAEFFARYFGVNLPLSARFYDQSLGNITSWHWDFGDGSTSEEQNPIHTYENEGTHTVTLTIIGPDGSDFKTKTNYVVGIIGSLTVDNTDMYKYHYGDIYRGSWMARAIMDARPVGVPTEEFKYSRIFFNSCVSEDYYLPKFTHGIAFYTIGGRDATADPTAEYLITYLLGATDDEILQAINAVNYIHGYYNFNKLPPSMR